jgi:predicted HicB family RNase H-like nuclease
MANQRSKKRDKLIGAFVSPELKNLAVLAAKEQGITVADYVRNIITQSVKESHATNNSKK